MKNKFLTFLMVLALVLVVVGGASPVSAAAYGTSFTTAITYQNVGTGSATIVIDFYADSSSTPIVINLAALAANAGTSIYVGSLAGITSGFKGSAVMSSNQPLVATLVQVPPTGNAVTSRPLSSGATSGGATVLVPTVLKSTFGYTSVISVQNIDSVGADLAVQFIPASGTGFTINVTNLPAGSAKYFDMGTLVNASLGATFNGSMRVTAVKTGTATPGIVIANSLEMGVANNLAYAFEGASQYANKVFMPSAFCRYTASQYYSYYAVQNTGTTPVNITVTYNNGKTESYLGVAGGAKVSISGCGKTNNLNPNGFIGSAILTATGPIAAMGKIQNNAGLATAFLGFVDGATKISLPYVRWTETGWVNGTRQRTYMAIQNIGTAALPAGVVTIKYYDKDGILKGTHTISTAIAIGGKVNSTALDAGAGTEFGYSGTQYGGSAVVQGPAGSKLAVVARVQGITSGEDYNGTPIQ